LFQLKKVFKITILLLLHFSI